MQNSDTHNGGKGEWGKEEEKDKEEVEIEIR